MSRIGFLLGAGASYPFGIPMMRELYTGFAEYIAAKRPHCATMMEKISTGTDSTLDLEALISQLDKIRAVRDGLGVLERNTEQDLLEDLKIADELRGYLDAYLIEVCEQFSRSEVANKLTKFVAFCDSHDANIFSTNYDRLIETASDAISVSCIDGFEQNSNRPESAWLGELKRSKGVKLIKLHGSVNWYREELTSKIFRLEKGYSLPSHEYRLTHGDRALRPLMIIPTLEKVVLQNPYATLLTEFSDALRETQVLIVIGNSMRDEHIRNTIGTRSDGLEIILVNPQPDGYSSVFGDGAHVHLLPIGMEEFIDVGIPMLIDALGRHSLEEEGEFGQMAKSYVVQVARAVKETSEMSEEDRRLVERLKTSSQDEKIHMMRQIGDTAHKEVVAIVRKGARDGVSEAERIAAIDALVSLGDVHSVDLLFEIAGEASSLTERAEAVLAAKAIAERGGIDVSLRMGELAGQSEMMNALVRRGA